MNVAIIPARGGSTRIPRKNVRPFFGKPIIAYSIETAQASSLFDGGIYCSTEDLEIAGIAAQYGATWINRPPELAEVDGAADPGTQEVTRHAIAQLLTEGKQIDTACCIYATAPMLTLHYLMLGYRILERNPSAAFAFSVYDPGHDPIRDAAQFYWGRAAAFLDRVPLDMNATNVWKIMVPRENVCDVNIESDWKQCEQMFAERWRYP